MDHFVRLDRLPADLEFPEVLQGKISYDSDRRSLVHHGPMSKQEFDILFALHTDSAYCRALEELFRVATWDAEERGHGNRKFVKFWVVGIATLFIVALVALCVVCAR
ncbi:MAG: hypothetical protein H6822_02220 [Planctomycetaceae bacterium]|nr:hypothetical protein [Planctomycetales bacterium]MCB9920966.1 hypothetical protein [Planctomycetaceae bacterium]